MAGYDGFSKSNNAIDAENDGRYPASIIEKMLKLPSGYIKNNITTSEWHHTGKYYRITKYYDINDVKEYLKENPIIKKEKTNKHTRQFDKIQLVDFIRKSGIFYPIFSIMENVQIEFKQDYTGLDLRYGIDEFCTIIKNGKKSRKKIKNIKFFVDQFEGV